VHSLGQTWVQIGRNPAASLATSRPISEHCRLEKAAQRKPGHVLPTFLALNSDGPSVPAISMPPMPVKVDPSNSGLPNTTNSLGQTRWQEMYNQMHAEDDVLRVNSRLGTSVQDMDSLYSAERPHVRPVVSSIFTYSSSDSTRYGSSSFGNALVVAKQALVADQGRASSRSRSVAGICTSISTEKPETKARPHLHARQSVRLGSGRADRDLQSAACWNQP